MKAFLAWMVAVMVALGSPLPATAMPHSSACAATAMADMDMAANDCCDQNCAVLGGACATCAALLVPPESSHPAFANVSLRYVTLHTSQTAQHGFEVDPPPPRRARA